MPSAARTSSRSSSSRFATSAVLKKVAPVILPPGRLRLATTPCLTGSSVITKRIGITDVAAFTASAVLGPPPDMRTGYAALDQLGCKCWQAVKVAVRPPVLDRHVLCRDVAGFSEASSKALQLWSDLHGRRGMEKPNHRHRRLLPMRPKRPSCRRAAEKRDELAPLHVPPRTRFVAMLKA